MQTGKLRANGDSTRSSWGLHSGTAWCPSNTPLLSKLAGSKGVFPAHPLCPECKPLFTKTVYEKAEMISAATSILRTTGILKSSRAVSQDAKYGWHKRGFWAGLHSDHPIAAESDPSDPSLAPPSKWQVFI